MNMNIYEYNEYEYGCETWVPYQRHISLQESFHIRRLQLILGLRWWHKVTHSKIRSSFLFLATRKYSHRVGL